MCNGYVGWRLLDVWVAGRGLDGLRMTAGGVVNFTLNEPGRTIITIYDISGRSVETILNSEMTAGNHSVNLNTTEMGSGVYFARVLSDGSSAVGRFVVLKR